MPRATTRQAFTYSISAEDVAGDHMRLAALIGRGEQEEALDLLKGHLIRSEQAVLAARPPCSEE